MKCKYTNEREERENNIFAEKRWQDGNEDEAESVPIE